MNKKTAIVCAAVGACLLTGPGSAQPLTPSEELGKAIFFDADLSVNGNQACAACHAPEAGWTGPDSLLNTQGAVYEGSVEGRFGNRKPPSSAYATQSPVLHFELEPHRGVIRGPILIGDQPPDGPGQRGPKRQAVFIGGNFWNGRATGEKLGNPAADQAQGPFLNPLEQALDSAADVVSGVCSSSYANLFKQVWGVETCDPDNVDAAYDAIALSIAAYEASPESNAFTSKYDYYLKGMAELTQEERMGLNLFKGKGKCANCHVLEPQADGMPPLFTDYSFDNLGLPRNPENPFYTQTDFNPQGFAWLDLGLGEFLMSRMDYVQFSAENLGKQKVPTLRNVDKRPHEGFVKAYGHNGYFKSLEGIVHFYNTRDIKPPCLSPLTPEVEALAQGCWPQPEVPLNINRTEIGNLHLSGAQEDAIVAFLKALSDGYQP